MSHTARLISITLDAEKLISYCARVSNPSNQENYDTAPKLLSYCIKHGHWSIFEMAHMVVEIETTRSIAAQILRHRSFSFQEFSQRYAEAVLRPELPQLRRQDTKNRQSSVDDLPIGLIDEYQQRIGKVYSEAFRVYQDMILDGVAKECAREVLPLATPTRLYMAGSIRSWIHYCQLRCANGTQKEHQMIANSIKDIIADQIPTVYEAAFT